MGPVALAAALLLAAWLLRALHRAAEAKRRRLVIAAAAAAEGLVPPLVPPTVAGRPVLGSTLDLGSGGAAFLHRCRKQASLDAAV